MYNGETADDGTFGSDVGMASTVGGSECRGVATDGVEKAEEGKGTVGEDASAGTDTSTVGTGVGGNEGEGRIGTGGASIFVVRRLLDREKDRRERARLSMGEGGRRDSRGTGTRFNFHFGVVGLLGDFGRAFPIERSVITLIAGRAGWGLSVNQEDNSPLL